MFPVFTGEQHKQIWRHHGDDTQSQDDAALLAMLFRKDCASERFKHLNRRLIGAENGRALASNTGQRSLPPWFQKPGRHSLRKLQPKRFDPCFSTRPEGLRCPCTQCRGWLTSRSMIEPHLALRLAAHRAFTVSDRSDSACDKEACASLTPRAILFESAPVDVLLLT